MDALYIILVAIGLIIGLLVIFTLLTYLFLSIFKKPSVRETTKALRRQKKKKGM